MSEAAQSPRLLIVRPQSSLSSTDSKLVSRDPQEKCDGPRSPTAVVRQGWLQRDSADCTHKHWSPTTSSAILSQSHGSVTTTLESNCQLDRHLARFCFLNLYQSHFVMFPLTPESRYQFRQTWESEHSSGANLFTFPVPDWLCMSPTACLKTV